MFRVPCHLSFIFRDSPKTIILSSVNDVYDRGSTLKKLYYKMSKGSTLRTRPNKVRTGGDRKSIKTGVNGPLFIEGVG